MLLEKNSHLGLISKSLLILQKDLENEKLKVEFVLNCQKKRIENMKRKTEKLKSRKKKKSEPKMLTKAAENQMMKKTNEDQPDDKNDTTTHAKDDSGRESDGSEHANDDKDTKQATATDKEHQVKIVPSYSYWTQYL